MSLMSSKSPLAAVWNDSNTFATTLLGVALDEFGPAVYEWTPLTIRAEIEDSFTVAPAQANFDRLMAAIAVVTTDSFFKNLPRFIQLCNVLSFDTFAPDEFDPASCAEMAWAITEALLLYPPDEDEPFSADICEYVGFMLRREGIENPPQILRFGAGHVPAKNLRAEYADRPDLLEQILKDRRDLGREIDKQVRENLSELMSQLSSLPLKNAQPGWAKKLQFGPNSEPASSRLFDF